ncbi:MAG: hypothetical protein ACOX6H_03905 [Christensenellales bacterium]|jgi:hypothetical protein
MKKSTLIIIGAVYILSILLVSLLGLKADVLNPKVSVTSIEIINQTDENWKVYTGTDNLKVIEVKFTEPGRADTDGSIKGTYVQLFWRVLPDNATEKRVTIVKNTNSSNVEFVKDENGTDYGLILIKGKVYFTATINSVDGSGVSTTVTIHAK